MMYMNKSHFVCMNTDTHSSSHIHNTYINTYNENDIEYSKHNTI